MTLPLSREKLEQLSQAELLRLFIEKIVVHEKEVKWSKHAPQTVEIYYNGIGYVGSGQQDVVITQQRYPLYQGAVVVCQGAGKASVRLAVTEAIAALTGLTSDKISVVKWKS